MDQKTTQCPVTGAALDKSGQKAIVRSLLGRSNKDWWPDSLPVDMLHQHGVAPDPMGEDFDYAEAFNALDYDALKADLAALIRRLAPPPAASAV